MFLTGQYPLRNGVTANVNSTTAPYGVELKQDARCWSDVLKDSNYSLGYIGKWHLDSPHEPYIATDTYNNRGPMKWNEWCPPERRHGFDFWYAYGTYDLHLRPMYWRTEAPRDGYHFVDQWGPEHEANVAIDFLNNTGGRHRDPDKPFALCVSMNPPHQPYDQVPARYLEAYAHLTDDQLGLDPAVPPAGTPGGDYFRKNQRQQLAMITGVDEQFGRILDALDASGQRENTIVIFTSDHGDLLGRHHGRPGALKQFNEPAPFEPAIRTPFLVRYPGTIAPRADDLLLSTPDIYPIMLDLLGLADRVPSAVQGRSLAPALRDETGAFRPSGQLYISLDPTGQRPGLRGISTTTHTLIQWPGTDETIQLFDRRTDPYQLQDCAATQPEVAAALQKELISLLEAINAPWPHAHAPN